VEATSGLVDVGEGLPVVVVREAWAPGKRGGWEGRLLFRTFAIGGSVQYDWGPSFKLVGDCNLILY
jgi:hypothetical protein